MIYDICIVGAGLWGSGAARRVSAHPDLKVCIVGPEEPATPEEFATRDVFAAHYDAGRICTTLQGTSRVGRVRSVLSERSMPRYADIEKQSGVTFYKDVGFIAFGDVHTTFDSIPDGASVETAEGIRSCFPYIETGIDGPSAVLARHGAGYINARKYVQAQLTLARRQGCEVIRDVVTRVTAVDQSEAGRQGGDVIRDVETHVTALDQSEQPDILVVETESGMRLSAKKVLLCTGAFTQFKELLPTGRKLDAIVTSDVIVRFELDSETTQRLHDMPCMSSEFEKPSPRECYILPPITYPDGKVYVKIGHGRHIDSTLHTHDDIRAWFTGKADLKIVEILKDIFHSVVKGVKPLAEIYNTCADLDTPTELPYCDMVSANLGVLIGGNSMGATVAEEMGRMGADMITGKTEWNLDIPKEVFKVKFVVD